jgi:hypothetical protein
LSIASVFRGISAIELRINQSSPSCHSFSSLIIISSLTLLGFLRHSTKMSASETVSSSASAVSTSSGWSTPSKLANGATRNGSAGHGNGSTGAAKGNRRSKYRHVAAYHSQLRHSSLSRETSVVPSFLGFRNLMVIVLGRYSARIAFSHAWY